MQQKANSECKVTIRLDARSVTVNRKNIELTPLVEPLIPALLKVPDDVGKRMGIPFIPKKMDIVLLDKLGFDRVYRDVFGPIRTSGVDATGIFYRGKEAIFLNPEDIQPEKDLSEDSIKNHLQVIIMHVAWHEATHLNHYAYDPSFFRRNKETTMAESVKKFQEERTKKNWLQNYLEMYRIFKDVPEWQLTRILHEGVACWVSEKLTEAYFGSDPQLDYLLEELPKDFSLIGKISSTLNDRHKIGNWFMHEVEGMTNVNPVKLVIDNQPKDFWELLYPVLYLERMSKEKVI